LNLSEGKRRKLAIASERKIIGFTIDEVEALEVIECYVTQKWKAI
jgi:hypothetical protein